LDFSSTKEASIKFALLCGPLHFAGIEIVIALDYPNLRGMLAELGLLSNLRRELSVIFMNGIDKRIALFSFARGHRGLNIADQ